MIKHHLQCLSHHKTAHLAYTTVKVKEQKTLLHRHAILLAFSECVMKWRWYCEWKCESNAAIWLKCPCCTLQCCDLEVLKYFRPLLPNLSVVKLQQGDWLYLKWSFDSEESTMNTAWSTEFLRYVVKHECFHLMCFLDGSVEMCATTWLKMEELQAEQSWWKFQTA